MAFPEPNLTVHEARVRCGPGATIVGVIGSPIAHSLSPLLHHAAFEALELDTWHSFAFEVAAGEAATALDSMRAEAIRGLSVTMPHKADVAALVDLSDDTARRLHAVNCVHNRGDALFGTNTDGRGFVESLRRGAGFEPAGRRCLVVGAGGAARAVVLALAGAGAVRVGVVNRTRARAIEAAALAGVAGVVIDVADVTAAAQEADLIVDATPVGMTAAAAEEDWLVAPELLGIGQVAADLVYVPRPTRWLSAAGAAGAVTVDGLGMLVHQAAAQVRLWTGLEPPVEAMWRAAEATAQ